METYFEALDRLSRQAISEGRAEPLTRDHPGTHDLQIALSKDSFVHEDSREAYYRGALAALTILGRDVTASREDLDTLARNMMMEARFYIP